MTQTLLDYFVATSDKAYLKAEAYQLVQDIIRECEKPTYNENTVLTYIGRELGKSDLELLARHKSDFQNQMKSTMLLISAENKEIFTARKELLNTLLPNLCKTAYKLSHIQEAIVKHVAPGNREVSIPDDISTHLSTKATKILSDLLEHTQTQYDKVYQAAESAKQTQATTVHILKEWDARDERVKTRVRQSSMSSLLGLKTENNIKSILESHRAKSENVSPSRKISVGSFFAKKM